MGSSDGADVVKALTAMLEQLEDAQGGADPEARARLDQLRRQLGALEEAQERAAHHEAQHPHHRPLQELPGGSAQGGGNSPPSDPAAMLQQMDGLARRLSGLEHRLEGLDQGTKEVLQASAGGWLGALQAEGEHERQELQQLEEEQGLAGRQDRGAEAAAASGAAGGDSTSAVPHDRANDA